MLCRGLSDRPLHPFGRILLEGVNEWEVMIFPCNTQRLACKATAEGVKGAIGKPPWNKHERLATVNPKLWMPERGFQGGFPLGHTIFHVLSRQEKYCILNIACLGAVFFVP